MHILLKGLGEIMKKFISLLGTLCLALSLIAVPVFAAEPSTEVNGVESVSEINDVTPRATSKGLYYVENVTLANQDVHNCTVTPDEGANLRIWLKNSEGPVTVNVAYTNWLGQWVGFYSQTFQPGERDVLIKSGCNGKRYQVKLSTSTYAGYSILVYQN